MSIFTEQRIFRVARFAADGLVKTRAFEGFQDIKVFMMEDNKLWSCTKFGIAKGTPSICGLAHGNWFGRFLCRST